MIDQEARTDRESIQGGASSIELVVGEGASGTRLDQFLAQELTEFSRSHLQRVIDSGGVTVDGAPSKRSHRLEAGGLVAVMLPEVVETELRPEAIPLSILFEDADVLIVDKPPGMVVHPAPGHDRGTLVNAVLAHLPELSVAGTRRPGIVHRLDKETSGVIAVAKSDLGQQALLRQWKERTVEKRYLALVDGMVEPESGTIDAPIERDPANRLRMAVRKTGRGAITHFDVLRRFGLATLLDVEPVTGRTHQIRVHLAFAGFPVSGDSTYNRSARTSQLAKLGLTRQFLHASSLSLHLPASGERVTFRAPLAKDLKRVLHELECTSGSEE